MPNKMEDVAIMFQQTVTQPLATEHFQVHVHPFDTLPLLPSHIRPHFVIYQAGTALDKLHIEEGIRIVEENPLLRKVVALYDAWRTDPPAGVMDNKDFNPDPPLEEDEEDDNTDMERIARARGVKRPRETTPTKRHNLRTTGGKYVANETHDLGNLSSRTLCEHTQDFGDGRWSSKSISCWVEECAVFAESV